MARLTPHERLPGEIEPPATARGLVASLAVMVALVLAVNALVVRASPRATRTYDGKMVDAKWRLASAGGAGGGVLVVGDSSGNFGVDAAVLAGELGVPATNLCTYGRFQVTGAGWLVDRAIETADAPPALVVAVFGARTFVLESDGFTMAEMPLAPFEWLRRTPGVGLGPVDAMRFTVARAFPLFTQSSSIGRCLSRWEWRPDLSRLVIEEDGTGRIPSANPDGVPRFADRTIAEYEAHEGPVPSERERAAVRGLVADADERGYDLVFATSPIWDGLVDRPEHARMEARIVEFLEEACAASPRAHVLPGPAQTFPASVMENPFHLTTASSAEFTRELSARLRSFGVAPGAR